MQDDSRVTRSFPAARGRFLCAQSGAIRWDYSVVGAALIFSGFFAFLAQTGRNMGTTAAAATPTSVKAGDIANPSSFAFGSDSGPIKLVMFGDYQCPPCRAEWPQITAFVNGHRDKVGFFFHNFPLGNLHADAVNAATAAELARSGGSFEQMQNLLYTGSLSEKAIAADMSNLKISPVRSAARIAAGKTVAYDMNLGNAIGVHATPTLYLVDTAGKVYELSSVAAAMPFVN